MHYMLYTQYTTQQKNILFSKQAMHTCIYIKLYYYRGVRYHQNFCNHNKDTAYETQKKR